jgi:uncharacterized protein (TIGR03067 family)
MKRTILIAGVSLCLTLAMRPSPVAAQGKKLAFLVGVQHYAHPKLDRLKYTEKDVTGLADILREAGYDVTLLSDTAGNGNPSLMPTKANIEKRLKEVLDRSNDRKDMVVLAFAGHGLQFEGQKDAYFCPRDAKPFVEDIATLVSMAKVFGDLERCFAGAKILMVDACRNDPKLGRGIHSDNVPRPSRGVAALFSCSAGEVAFEHPSLEHGVFFHFVIEGLRGEARRLDGQVTFQSLAEYVSEKVPNRVPDLIGGGAQQSPNTKLEWHGPSPVLLTRTGTNSVPTTSANNVPTTKIVLGPKIDGSWLLTGCTDQGKKVPEADVAKIKCVAVLKDGKYSFSVDGKVQETGTYKVDTNQDPAVLDLYPADGKDKGKIELALFKIEGDVLTIAVAEAGKQRPNGFEPAKEIEVQIYKRTK